MAYLRDKQNRYSDTVQDFCWACGHRISYPAIHRLGNSGSVMTCHTNCATELAIKILADVNHCLADTNRRISV